MVPQGHLLEALLHIVRSLARSVSKTGQERDYGVRLTRVTCWLWPDNECATVTWETSYYTAHLSKSDVLLTMQGT